MKLFYKLMLGYIATSALICFIIYFNLETSQTILQKAIIDDAEVLASELIDKIDRDIYYKIERWKSFSEGNSRLYESLKNSNLEFDRMPDRQRHIDLVDRDWKEGRETLFIKGLLAGNLSKRLRETIEYYQRSVGFTVFSEVFVTNKYGVNIAQTGMPSDYRQDDEQWWQAAKRDGLYVSDFGTDVSMGPDSIYISIRIDDENMEFAGILLVVLNIQAVTDMLKGIEPSGIHKDHRTRDLLLCTKEQQIIYSSGNNGNYRNNIAGLDHSTEDVSYFNTEDGRKIYVYARSKGHKAYKGHGWVLLDGHDREKIFAPVIKLRNRTLAIALIVVVTFLVIGYCVSFTVQRSLRKIGDAAKRIGEGDLNIKVGIKSNDEIGQLAGAFEDMAKDLKNITVSRDKLAAEITMRKKMENELVIWAGIFKHAEWGVAVANAKSSVFKIMNPAFAKMHGYTVEELIGRPVVDVYAPEFRAKVPEYIRMAYEKGHCTFESKHIRKDGSVFPVLMDITAVKDDSGKVQYRVANAHDITEQKELEKTVIEVEEYERRRIGHDLHDDLGQQLAGISYMAQNLSSGLIKKTAPEAHIASRITELIKKANVHVRQLSRGLSPLSGNIDVDFISTIEALLVDVRNLFNIKAVFKYDEDICITNEQHIAHLYRIIQEAITNAVKHGKAENIEVLFTKKHGKPFLEIKDDGQGMTGAAVQSSGIGFKIMEYRANLIGAFINIESITEKGTTVSCIF